jgi:hypothetical protein
VREPRVDAGLERQKRSGDDREEDEQKGDPDSLGSARDGRPLPVVVAELQRLASKTRALAARPSRRATLSGDVSPGRLRLVDEDLISREEIVALLFKVNDIAASLDRIETLLGDDDGEEEADEG